VGTYVFKLPDVGEGVAQAEIVAWHVNVGDEIKEDQPLVDVMTEKATVEIGSPVSGKILRRKGETGDMAAVGSELVAIATRDQVQTPSQAGLTAVETAPAARPPPPSASSPQAQATSTAPVQPRTSKPTAAPAVRARAQALGIDLAAVKGSGPDGRVRHEDLDALLALGKGDSSAGAAPARDGVEEIRVIGLRRQIAQTMQEAKRSIPHFSYVEEVDVTALEALRRDLNQAQVEGRPRLTLLPFLIRSIVTVLPDHPGINAHFDDAAGIIRRYGAVHIGIATQTPRGLLVPVIRHAETLGLSAIATEITRLSEAARAGKAAREELSGSTITVTSLGALGGIAATPIIKPPEVAIVGVNKIIDRPVVREGRIVIRKMMNLSSSFDHRIVDGFDAASFIQALKARLETPARLLVVS
jgi:2-oxoisovalerate dehydrogenase E2 component (dihydrolipoyl transacylase)